MDFDEDTFDAGTFGVGESVSIGESPVGFSMLISERIRRKKKEEEEAVVVNQS